MSTIEMLAAAIAGVAFLILVLVLHVRITAEIRSAQVRDRILRYVDHQH